MKSQVTKTQADKGKFKTNRQNRTLMKWLVNKKAS